MAKIDAGQAVFTLSAKDNTGQTLSKTESRLKRLGSKFKAVGAGMATMGRVGVTAMVGMAGAATMAGAAAVAVGKSWANEADRLAKQHRVLGITTDALQEMEYAARANGVSAKQMGNMMSRSYRRMANAGKEGGPALRAMQELGINADELSKKSPEKAFYGLIDALSKVEDEAFRNQLAFETLGDEWKFMAPFLNDGTKALDDARDKFHELNLGMTETEILAGEEMAQAFSDLGDATTKMKNTVGAAVAGPLTRFLDWLTNGIGKLQNFKEAMGGWKAMFRQVFEVGVASTALALMNVWDSVVTHLELVWVGFFKRIQQMAYKTADLLERLHFTGQAADLRIAAGGINVDGRAGRAAQRQQIRQDAIDQLRRDLGNKMDGVAKAMGKPRLSAAAERGSDDYIRAPRTFDMAGPKMLSLLAAQSTILSGFALGGVGSVMGGTAKDPKEEEKKMVKEQIKTNQLLEDMNKVT